MWHEDRPLAASSFRGWAPLRVMEPIRESLHAESKGAMPQGLLHIHKRGIPVIRPAVAERGGHTFGSQRFEHDVAVDATPAIAGEGQNEDGETPLGGIGTKLARREPGKAGHFRQEEVVAVLPRPALRGQPAELTAKDGALEFSHAV